MINFSNTKGVTQKKTHRGISSAWAGLVGRQVQEGPLAREASVLWRCRYWNSGVGRLDQLCFFTLSRIDGCLIGGRFLLWYNMLHRQQKDIPLSPTRQCNWREIFG